MTEQPTSGSPVQAPTHGDPKVLPTWHTVASAVGLDGRVHVRLGFSELALDTDQALTLARDILDATGHAYTIHTLGQAAS